MGGELACVRCGKVPESSMPTGAPAAENTPYGATVFQARGQYGSTVFDPLDESFLEINVCDPCLVELAQKPGNVLVGDHGRPMRPPTVYRPWSPEPDALWPRDNREWGTQGGDQA